MLDLDRASEELKQKNYKQIQEETAWTWASRACVSYQNCENLEGTEKLVCWTVAEELYHESIEHAALSGNDGLLQQIRDAVHPYQEKAAFSMGVKSKETDTV